MAVYRELFDFAAKIGCLEGYLYERHNLEPAYLPNWTDNIERTHRALPEDAKKDIREPYLTVLKKVSDHCEKLLGANDPMTKKVAGMLAELEG